MIIVVMSFSVPKFLSGKPPHLLWKSLFRAEAWSFRQAVPYEHVIVLGDRNKRWPVVPTNARSVGSEEWPGPIFLVKELLKKLLLELIPHSGAERLVIEAQYKNVLGQRPLYVSVESMLRG